MKSLIFILLAVVMVIACSSAYACSLTYGGVTIIQIHEPYKLIIDKEFKVFYTVEHNGLFNKPLFVNFTYHAKNLTDRPVRLLTEVWVNGRNIYVKRGFNITPKQHYDIRTGLCVYIPVPEETVFDVEIVLKGAYCGCDGSKSLIIQKADIILWQ